MLYSCGKEAVAEPAGTLARGAVHIDIEGVLPEGLNGGVIDALYRLVGTVGIEALDYLRLVEIASYHTYVANLYGTADGDDIQVL